jgi:hypothetical protein
LGSLSLVLMGLLTAFLFPVVFAQLLQQMMTIVPGTPAHQAWKQPDLPTIIR